MIGRILRFGVYTLLGLAFLSWGALQFPRVHLWCKKGLEELASQETGCSVTIGALHGFPPFLLGCDDVHISQNGTCLVKIASIDLIPEWIEMLLGKLSFAYAGAHGIDLTQFKMAPQESSSNLKIPSIDIYSFRLSQIMLAQHYFEPILASRCEKLEVDCYLNASGSVSWNPKKEELKARCNLMPCAGSLAFATLDATLHANPATTALSATLEAAKMPEAAVFVSLFCDRMRLKLALVGNTPQLLGVHNDSSPLLTGKWEASGLSKIDNKLALSPIVRFSAQGTLEAKDLHSFTFATEDLSCHKIDPNYSFSQQKTSQANQELSLIASVDDGESVAPYESITALPTPKRVQGSFSIDDRHLHFQTEITSLVVGDQHISSCGLNVDASGSEEGWSGELLANLNLEVDKNELPIALQCGFKTDGEVLVQLPKVYLTAKDFLLAGQLEASLFPFVLRGTLQTPPTPSSELLKLFSMKAQKASCLISFDPEETNDRSNLTQKALLHVELEDFGCGELFCKEAILHVTERGLLLAPHFDAIAAAKKIQSKNRHIDSVLLTSTIDHAEQKAPFIFQVRGTTRSGPFSLDCGGSFGPTHLQIDPFTAKVCGHTLHSKEAISFDATGSGLELKPFELAVDDQPALFGKGALAPESLSFSLTSEQFPLEIFEPLTGDFPLHGPVSGHLELAGSAQNPQLVCTLASSDLKLSTDETKKSLPLIASFAFSYADKLARSHLEIQGLNRKLPTLISLEAPFFLSFLPLEARMEENAPLTGHLAGQFDLKTLLSSCFDEEEILDGLVTLDATLRGTKAKPLLSGHCSISDGTLFIPAIGACFQNIHSEGLLDGSGVSFAKITASDGQNGSFVGSSTINNILDKELGYHVEGIAKNFAAVVLDEARAAGSGPLKLVGGLESATLSGTLDVTEASLSLSKELGGDLPKLEITYIGDKENFPFKQETPFQFHLDLNLAMPEGKMQGMGLDADWKGQAHLTGVNDKLDLVGCMALLSGSLKVAGKQFVLTQGTIEFQGDILSKSKLQVIATHDIGSISTQVVLQGPLESPRIIFQSNPAMTQKEILSLILFNKSSTEITPMQGIQLGKTLFTLNSKGDNFDLLEKIKETLHIDRLDFGSPQTVGPSAADETIPNEVSVQVGKYISDGVIVTLSKDVTNEVNRIGIEANIANHITAQANVGDDSETELALEWKVKY